MGKVILRVEMRILEPGAEGRGEILIRGPVVMQGCFGNEAATREVLLEDGWLATGGVGYLDHENYLFLTVLKKSLIVTEGGKNAYPEEIEAVAYPSFEQLRETGTDP